MHIHIAVLGEHTESVLRGFDLIPAIDKICLICSKTHPDSADTVGSFLSGKNIAYDTVLADETDFQRTSDIISGIVDGVDTPGPHRYSFSVTDGSVPMALAAYHSASLIDAPVYYVPESGDSGPLTIPTVKVAEGAGTRGKGKAILRFILERTSKEGIVSNRDIETEFGMKKQQVSYYVRNLRESGLITTDSGVFDVEKNTMNYRFNSIRLTDKGRMEAGFLR